MCSLTCLPYLVLRNTITLPSFLFLVVGRIWGLALLTKDVIWAWEPNVILETYLQIVTFICLEETIAMMREEKCNTARSRKFFVTLIMLGEMLLGNYARGTESSLALFRSPYLRHRL